MDTSEKDAIYTRINRLMRDYSRTSTLYTLISEILFTPMYTIDSASLDFEEKLENVEGILRAKESNTLKISKLKKLIHAVPMFGGY
jgi:hypothetical protein